jgi:hypothetical protein
MNLDKNMDFGKYKILKYTVEMEIQVLVHFKLILMLIMDLIAHHDIYQNIYSFIFIKFNTFINLI